MRRSMENTEKFTGKADVYAKYRPGYPAELFDICIINILWTPPPQSRISAPGQAFLRGNF